MGEIYAEELQEFVGDGVRSLVEHLFLLLEFLYKNNHEFMEDYKLSIDLLYLNNYFLIKIFSQGSLSQKLSLKNMMM